jgi:amino-acid N-acetyltransferase
MSNTAKGTIASPPAPVRAGFAVRKASLADIPSLLALVNAFAARGIMLPRSEFEMAENIRDFSVIQLADRVAGCAALHFYTPKAAEVRSLAILPDLQGYGAGKALVSSLEREAQAFGVQDLFAFTYIPDFFRKMGFTSIERGELPLKAWKDCLRCPKFQCCDEVAVIKRIPAGQARVLNTRICGVSSALDSDPEPPVLLPVLRNPH